MEGQGPGAGAAPSARAGWDPQHVLAGFLYWASVCWVFDARVCFCFVDRSYMRLTEKEDETLPIDVSLSSHNVWKVGCWGDGLVSQLLFFFFFQCNRQEQSVK